MVRKVLPAACLLLASLAGKAQGGFESPADTVYLQDGRTATVHIKRIEPSRTGSASAYQIRTHESLDLTDKDIWSDKPGGYQWTAERFMDGFRSLDVGKVVFADGFVLPFVGGELDRRLLLQAPWYGSQHGDFVAEGVIPLTREEMRMLMGDEAYYLGYRVAKIRAGAGLAKLIVGASSGFLCYLTRGSAIRKTEIPSQIGSVQDYIGSAEYRYNPYWQTGTAAAAVTAVYGLAELAIANGSIRALSSSFREFRAPSAGSFRTKALLGGGLLLAGGAVTYLGFNRMAKDPGWSETYSLQTTAGMEVPVKTGESGRKMRVPWLLPAAGALLVNLGLTELTDGLAGRAGIRAAGLERAQLQVSPAPCGMGLSLVF